MSLWMKQINFGLLLLVGSALLSVANGQTSPALPTRLAIGSTTYFNHSYVAITEVGRGGDISPALACFFPDPMTAEWYYPDGTVVPLRQGSSSAPGTITSLRQPTAITLHRGNGALSPTGLYCCGSPTASVDHRLCIHLDLCPSLPTLVNGVITYFSGGLHTVATYSCNYGYQLVGDVRRNCQTSTTWSQVAPTCQEPRVKFTLHDQIYLNNSVVAINDIGEEDDALLCVTDRSDCCYNPIGEFYYPNNNSAVGYSTTNSLYRSRGTQVVRLNRRSDASAGIYRCEVPDSTGLIINVYINITDIVIDCGALPNPTNGQVNTSSGTTLNRLATYSCYTGYVLTGESIRVCRADGRWNSTAPTCVVVNCGIPAIPEHGSVDTPTGTVFNDLAKYSCDVGHMLVGASRRLCGSDGTWIPGAPSCPVVDCGPLSHPDNGMVDTTSGTIYNSIATYTCDSGYILNGVVSQICQANKTWSNTEPVCESQSVYLTIGNTTYYTNNSEIVVTQIGSEDSNTLFCHTDNIACCRGMDNPNGNKGFGQWIFPDGSEVPKETSSSPANAFVFSKGPQVVHLKRRGNVIFPLGTYCCNIPDRISENKCFCVNLVAITCMPLTVDGNGGISVMYSPNTTDGSGNYYYGTRATYSCSFGFGLNGFRRRMCVGNGDNTMGMFNGSAPTCEPITCSSLPTIENGIIIYSNVSSHDRYAFGTNATYHCNEGYSLEEGDDIRTCVSDGSSSSGIWNGQSPKCTAVDCGPLPNPVNGRVDTSLGTTFQKVAMYSCVLGYTLSGSATRRCRHDRLWIPSAPTCVIVDCGPLPKPEKGYVHTPSGTTYNSVATYYCIEGYVLLGNSERRCGFDGSWSPAVPSCVPVDCGSLPDPENGRVKAPSGTTYNNTVKYSCYAGYMLIGEEMRTCQSNLSWTPTAPYCVGSTMMQLKFGPTDHCIQWNERKAAMMERIMRGAIQKALLTKGNYSISLDKIHRGIFSCRSSVTQTTFRTTIMGTKSLSAVDLVGRVQKWVESGPAITVQWYLVDIDKSCPVVISSMGEQECD